MKLIRPESMPLDYKGNGCGSGWKEPLVPDTLGGINISEACAIHDYEYEIGGSDDDFHSANFNFLRNMITIIRRDDTVWTNESVALKWAMQYFLAVEDHGRKYFNFKV